MPGALQQLEDQIRQRWGQYSDWRSADQDQVADLARLLDANGITDLNKLTLTPDKWTYDVYDAGSEGRDATNTTHTQDAWNIAYDGKGLGFLGDINNDGSVTAKGGKYGPINVNLGYSSRGHGSTNFQIVKDPRTGEAVVVPVWGSSSAEDYETARGMANIVAMAVGAYYAPSLGVPAATLGETMAQGALIGQGTSMATSAILNPEGDLFSAGLRGWIGGGLGAGAKELMFGTGADAATEAAWRTGDGLGKDTLTNMGLNNSTALEGIDFNNLQDLINPLTTTSLDPSALDVNFPDLTVEDLGTIPDGTPARLDFNPSDIPTDYSHEGRNYIPPTGADPATEEAWRGGDGLGRDTVTELGENDPLGPSNTGVNPATEDAWRNGDGRGLDTVDRLGENDPFNPNTNYSHEGNNYPDPGSTQGPGGSPINSSTTEWYDRLGNRLTDSLTNFGNRLVDLDPNAWKMLITGAGALNQIFGGNRNPGGTPGTPGGTPGNKFGNYNTWTQPQQGMFDRFANRGALRQPWKPLAKYAAGGDVGGYADGGGALGLVGGATKGQADDVPALLSSGEYVLDADVVSALGDGSNEAGARELDRMRARIRAHKRAAPANRIPPPAKKPEAYLSKGKK